MSTHNICVHGAIKKYQHFVVEKYLIWDYAYTMKYSLSQMN